MACLLMCKEGFVQRTRYGSAILEANDGNMMT